MMFSKTLTISPIPCLLPYLLPAMLGACVSAGGAERRPPVLPAPPADEPSASPAPAPVTAPDPAVRVFQDPRYKKRFAESYLAETEIEPRITADDREVMLEVLASIAAEEPDAAARLLGKHRGPTASAVFDFTFANLRFQQDDLEAAASAYQLAVDKYPKFRRAWTLLGQVHFRQGDFQSAAAAISRAIELGGGSGLLYGLLGVALGKLDDPVAAESAFRLATMLDPLTIDWKMGLADSFFRQARFPEAVALFERLIAAQPDRADLWLAQGEAHARMNQPLKAAENFEMADRLGGSTAASLDNLGDIYANEELFDLAVGAYLGAMAKAPEARPERALRAAKFLCANGALDATRKLIDGIRTTHGDRLEAGDRKALLELRARLAIASGAGEEEARVLQEIIALDPLDGDALILLGQHYARSGKVEEAVFYYERAAGMETFEANAKVRHAQLLVGAGRYGEALPLLRRAQALQPRENVREYLEQVAGRR